MNTQINKKLIFDIWANYYDLIYPSILYQAAHRRMLDYINLATDSIVLDIGCGTGKLLRRLSTEYPSMKGIGLDFSNKMLFHARQSNKNNLNLLFLRGDSYPLQFTSDYFSDIFCAFSFLHYKNPYFFFREVFRTLKPNGSFYLVDPILLESIEVVNIPITPEGISLYSRKKRENIGYSAGFRSFQHYYLLGSTVLSKFTK